MQDLIPPQVSFTGPFSLIKNSKNKYIFSEEMANNPGIYIWTIKKDDAYHALYVGMSMDLAKRTRGHLKAYMSGEYWVYDPDELKNIVRVPIHHPNQKPENFLKNYIYNAKNLYKMLNKIDVFLAPLNIGKKTLKILESSLIASIKQKSEFPKFLENQRCSVSITGDKGSFCVVSDFVISGLSGDIAF